MNNQKFLLTCLLLMTAIPAAMTQPEQEQKTAPQQQTAEKSTPAALPVFDKVEMEKGDLSLRTNILYWAVATPNLGVEWKPSGYFGILVNGSWSHWIWNEEGKQHRTWFVQPELRRYFGENRQWFVGIEGHIAEFNFKFGDTGYQGNVLGGGITGGYRLRISGSLDMDFSLGFGYTDLKYETYYRSNSVMVRKENELKKNSFSPTQAGISLILKL